MIFLLLFTITSLATPCYVIDDVTEAASLVAAGLTCGSSGSICDDSSGSCSLVSATNVFIQLNSTITVISFPQLRNTSGHFLVNNNDALVSVRIPLLASTGTYCNFFSNSALEMLNFPSFVAAGDYFYVGGHATLRNLTASSIRTVGSFIRIESNNVNFTNVSICWPSITVLNSTIPRPCNFTSDVQCALCQAFTMIDTPTCTVDVPCQANTAGPTLQTSSAPSSSTMQRPSLAPSLAPSVSGSSTAFDCVAHCNSKSSDGRSHRLFGCHWRYHAHCHALGQRHHF